jgi:hypothetical protein
MKIFPQLDYYRFLPACGRNEDKAKLGYPRGDAGL